MGFNYTQMNVEEIRAELIKRGYSDEEVQAIKGKSALVAELDKHVKDETKMPEVVDSKDLETVLDTAVVEELEENAEQNTDVVEVPELGDPEWHDYVMQQFTNNELIEGNPTVDGLRRVAGKLIGEIIASESIVTKSPSIDDATATVVHTVTFETNNRHKHISGSADASPRNSDEPFDKYPVALAESRAEGRALRRALQLTKVVAAEELSKKAREADDYDDDAKKPIYDAQVRGISTMSQRLDIDVQKLILTKSTPEHPITKIDDFLYPQALDLLKELNSYQNGEKEVPAELKGYKQNWRDN